MNKLQIFIILLFLVCNTGFTQSDSYFKNGINDDVVFRGINIDNYYYYLLSSGTYSSNVDFREFEIKGYDNFLLKFDESLNVVDSLYFDSIDGYQINFRYLTTVNDTLILAGRALKTDLSDEQIIISKYLLPSLELVDQQLYGEPDVYELINDMLINYNGNIIVAINNTTDFSDRNLIIMEIDKNGGLLRYINDTTIDIEWTTVYQMPSTLDYHFNTGLRTIIFDSTISDYNSFWNPNLNNFYYWGKKCYYNDSTFIISGVKITPLPLNPSFDIYYFQVNDQSEFIDSGFIYLPDTLDFIGGVSFVNPSTVVYGGTHNKNWTQQTPGIFEEENRWIVLKSEDIITKNENWFFTYGGDANYVMRDLLITENNSFVICCTRYDWENTDVWQRDVLIFEIDSNGIIVSSNAEIEIPYATVYPNPGRNTLSIRNGFNEGKIIIQDLKGSVVLEKPISNFESIDVSDLNSGPYLILFFEKDKYLFSQKWIKA